MLGTRDAGSYADFRFKRERLGEVEILYLSGEVESAAAGRLERALRDACNQSQAAVVIVSLLECGKLDPDCAAALARLTASPTNRMHVVVAPESRSRLEIERAHLTSSVVHDGFVEAFRTITILPAGRTPEAEPVVSA